MRPNMILKQNVPYAALICSALDVCEIMLARSSTLYPFAVISVDNDVHSVFSDISDDGSNGGLIEDLTARLSNARLSSENAISVLVYAAALQTEEGLGSDAIVFNITDTSGKNTITLYPYSQEANTIKLGVPFTCDFAD